MQFTRFSGSIAALGLTLAVFAPLDASAASRSRSGGAHGGGHVSQVSSRSHESGARFNTRAVRYGMAHARGGYAVRDADASGGGYGGRLQCVPFARENTGIELAGNAATWWNNADGVYARGARPEVGSVLNFRANGRMRMGHVAVVSNVIDGRNIQIDHANWAGPGASRGGVSRNITVVDVSERNDWTAVRVALGHTGDFGSVYPTYGFIYDRADSGVMTANNAAGPAPQLNAAPRDLRPAADRAQFAMAQDVEEVAEADDEPRGHYGRRSGRHATRLARSFGGRATVQRVSSHGFEHGTGRATGHAVAHTGRRHRL